MPVMLIGDCADQSEPKAVAGFRAGLVQAREPIQYALPFCERNTGSGVGYRHNDSVSVAF